MEKVDRLESFGIYRLARELFDEFGRDSEILGKDYRGRELCKQQVRSLDSICANIEEGYGRGFGKELPQRLRITRGEARESRGRYERCAHLLPADTISKRVATLDHIIGGLTKTVDTIESRKARRPLDRSPVRPLAAAQSQNTDVGAVAPIPSVASVPSRHPSPVTRPSPK